MNGLWTLGYVLGITAFCLVVGLLVSIRKTRNDIKDLKNDVQALKDKK